MESDNVTKYITFYSNSKTETIINEKDIEDVFKSIYATIIWNIRIYFRKDSGWIIDLVIDHNINILGYNPLSVSNYTKFSKELDHPRKVWLIFEVLTVTNTLHGVWLHTYILKIRIQEKE